MLAPPPGTSAADQVLPGQTNPGLTGVKIGWDQVNALINGGCVSGMFDLQTMKAAGDYRFAPAALDWP